MSRSNQIWIALSGFVTHINKLVAIFRDISPTLINQK